MSRSESSTPLSTRLASGSRSLASLPPTSLKNLRARAMNSSSLRTSAATSPDPWGSAMLGLQIQRRLAGQPLPELEDAPPVQLLLPGAWQCVGRLDDAPRSALHAEPVTELGGEAAGARSRRRIRPEADDQADVLAAVREGERHGGHLVNSGNVHRCLLDLVEVDGVAALHHDVLQPSDRRIAAVLVAAQQVASAEPGAGEGRRRGPRVAVVAVEERRPGELELTFTRSLDQLTRAAAQPRL